jgi:hypothetical protein
MTDCTAIPGFKPLGRRLMDAASVIFECPRDLRGHREEALHARYAVMVILRECNWSYPRIGHRLGRDHSSVKTALKVAERLARENGFFAGSLGQLRALASEYRLDD